MIVSAIDGRIRVVEPALNQKVKADAIEAGLRAIRGVKNTTVNRITGSLLVVYDADAIDRASMRNQIKKRIRAISNRSSVGVLNGRRPRRYVKYGLLGTITASIGLLYYSESWHFRVGSAFLSLLSLHLFQNRKRLLK